MTLDEFPAGCGGQAVAKFLRNLTLVTVLSFSPFAVATADMSGTAQQPNPAAAAHDPAAGQGQTGNMASGGNTTPGVGGTSPAISMRNVAQAPWFALASGVASILGLILALYGTQVRTIPFSLYRSLMWRKVLLLSIGAGFMIFGIMKFYNQDEAPYLSPLREAHALLRGYLFVSPYDNQPHGTVVWPFVALVGSLLFAIGLLYDPAVHARRILVREYDALHGPLDDQIAHLRGSKKISELEPPDTEMLADALEYYRHVQWRFTDVVLGAPPPTFPLLHRHRGRTLGQTVDDINA